MITAVPVILSGGNGTRLWPLSRNGFPKQFLSLIGNQTLFQQAVQRTLNIKNHEVDIASPIVVCGEDHRFLVLEQLRELGVDLGCALLEPFSRNTAPALTLAAFKALESGNDPILLVTPADHDVRDVPAFAKTMQFAIKEAVRGSVVILGIQPNTPQTGYGYIQIETSGFAENLALDVKRFVEKPNLTAAQAYLNHGGYFWNAGIFVVKSSVWLNMLEKFKPDIFLAVKSSWDKRNVDLKFIRPGVTEFELVPSESIDCAVIEHCPDSKFSIKMISMDAGWNDLGAWNAVWDTLPKDNFGNAAIGDVLAVDSCNTLIHASSRLVGVVGVKNLIVVETPDAVLVADKLNGCNIKSLVNLLSIKDRDEHLSHRKVNRPWGWYDTIDSGEGFKVKRIQVKPKASLSLQRHRHRAEHWIIVKGIAEITKGNEVMFLRENQSAYIPLGELHRLSNPGDSALEIIEVQTGKILEEVDIERFEDKYGR